MFNIATSKSFDEGKLKLLSNKQENLIEFIGRTRINNGIKGYVERLKLEPNMENTISISQIGTITAQIRTKKWYASQNIFILSKKGDYEKLISLYVVSSINKSLRGSFSDGYGNYPTLSKLKDLVIQLPTKNNEPDFEFMENFISILEKEKIDKLDSYISVSGLKNYNLTAEEEKALYDLENDCVEWGEFTYNTVFNKIAQGKRLKKGDQLPGKTPFVMAGIFNTGIANYISNPVARFPKNSITIDIFGNTFYRNYEFGAGDDTGVYWSTEKEYTKETMLFFATAMAKSVRGKFDYGTKLRSSRSLDFTMQLPAKNKQPDYELMQTLISAIQKLVIKDVVLYVDKKLGKSL